MKININDICFNHDANLCASPCHGCDDFESKSIRMKVTKKIIVKQKSYQVGDKVLIKKSWKKVQDVPCADMDRYKNTIVTIKNVYDNTVLGTPNNYRIKEDDGYWTWYGDYIKGKIIE